MPQLRRPIISDQEVKRLLDSLDAFVVPLEGIPWLDGAPLTAVALNAANNVIPHRLGRTPRGWWVTRSYDAIGFQARAKYLRSQDGGGNGGATINVTLQWQPTSGNCMIAAITTNNDYATASIAQTGATWVQVATHSAGAGTARIELWMAPQIASPGTGVVFTPATAYSNWAVVTAEYAGVLRAAAATVLDQAAGNNGSASPAFTGALTPAERHEWAVAGVSHISTFATFSNPRDSWIIRDRAWGGGARATGRTLSLMDRESVADGVATEARADVDLAGEWTAAQILAKTAPIYSGYDYPLELARDRENLTLQAQMPRTVDLWVF